MSISSGSVIKAEQNLFETNTSLKNFDFDSKIGDANLLINQIEHQSNKLKDLTEKAENIVSTSEEELLSEELEKIIEAFEIRKEKFQSIIEDCNNYIKTSSEDKTSKQEKHKLFTGLINRYTASCEKFKENEMELKNKLQNKLIRNAEIILQRDLSEKEKNDLIEEPKKIQKIMNDQIVGDAPVQLQNALQDLESRHQDIEKLAKNVEKITKMIQELNMMVQQQGNIIDSVAVNVEKTKVHTEKAGGNLNEAEKNLKAAKRKKCICITIIVVVVLALVLLLILLLK